MLRKPVDSKGREKLEKMKGELKGAMLPSFKQDESVSVYVDQYAVTDASSSTPIVGSANALPCLLIGLYDSKNKRAGCAHTSVASDIHSLENMVQFFSIPDTVAHLMGGNENLALCLNTVEFLERKGIRIVNAHIDYLKLKEIISEPPAVIAITSASMAIDARTGCLYSPVPFSLKFDNDIARRQLQASANARKLLPIEEVFNAVSKKLATKDAPSFHGLQADFLNIKPAPEQKQPSPPDSGLRNGLF